MGTNRSHRDVLVAWGVVGVAAVVGVWPEMRALLAFAWIAALVISKVTWQRVRADSSLVAKRLYRAALAALLLSAAAETIAAASTVVVTKDEEQLGFVFVAGAGVALSITAWGALTRPSTKRAARAGTFALFLPFAGLVDILVGTAGDNQSDIRDGLWPTVMVGGFGVLCVAGMLACVAAIVAFGAPSALPEARQVE